MCYCAYQFFFFKQKTAYEMRISDWSSDGCSSELDRELGLTVYIGQRKGHATTGDWSDAGIAQAVDAALAIAAATGADPCNGLAAAALMAGPAGGIGSAAGRGRGCHQVLVSVGAVGLNKQKNKQFIGIPPDK